jgi:hypothetical protein
LFRYVLQTDFGTEESDEDSDDDAEVPDISHMPAVNNPLSTLQHSELLLRFPRATFVNCISLARGAYRDVR